MRNKMSARSRVPSTSDLAVWIPGRNPLSMRRVRVRCLGPLRRRTPRYPSSPAIQCFHNTRSAATSLPEHAPQPSVYNFWPLGTEYVFRSFDCCWLSGVTMAPDLTETFPEALPCAVQSRGRCRYGRRSIWRSRLAMIRITESANVGCS